MANRSALTRLGLVIATMMFPVGLAQADLGSWSHALIGTWRNPTSGDLYRFSPNATYTFTAGQAKARGGQLAHSGYWKIAKPTESESGGSMEGPVALVLNSRTRTVRRNGRKVTLVSHRSFRLVVDVVQNDEREIDPNHYIIGHAKWVRVR